MAMKRFTHFTWVLAFMLSGCGGGGGSEAPARVSLVAPTGAEIQEAENPKLEIRISLDTSVSSSLTVPLIYSGTATRGEDYTASADSILLPPRTTSGSVEIDVFRDFDTEGDETIGIAIGMIVGNGEPGATSDITLTLVDGEPLPEGRVSQDMGPNLAVLGQYYLVGEQSIDLAAWVLNTTGHGTAATRLIAEWSADPDFATDINVFGAAEVPAFAEGQFNFPPPHQFSLPLSLLMPEESYRIRLRLEEVPEETHPLAEEDNRIEYGFLTDTQGKVVTRCIPPERVSQPGTVDPLFSEQWNLENNGQFGFSEVAGTPGADLRMIDAMRLGRNGAGVKLAVVDTGLEICHPDLAANIEQGKSFNFGFAAGSSLTDPFNHITLGDHGTSVAGVAAAVADNGLGGRGVAPGLKLRGFNVGAGTAFSSDFAILQALGASSDAPDSASVDIFNMSFGIVAPAVNPLEEFTRLFKMGTQDLREGRGALYVKAAGNAFSGCEDAHPLGIELGCAGSQLDPDQNLPYLITVGAFNARDTKSSYSSAGANLWVVAPAGEDGIEGAGVITTDQHGVDAGFTDVSATPLDSNHALNPDGDYMSSFGGTSSAAPAAAGAIAVILAEHPDFTWRDVKHVLADSARQIDPGIRQVRAAFKGTPYIAQHAWQTNSAGYSFHNWYGFGAVAIDAALEMANGHSANSLGEFVESEWFAAGEGMDLPISIPDADGAGARHSISVIELPNTANIEAVVVELDVDHSYASDLGVTLTSPSGMQSVLNTPFSPVLDAVPGFFEWQLLSNAFYGESPNGTWTLHVADLASEDTGSLNSWRLRFYYADHP